MTHLFWKLLIGLLKDIPGHIKHVVHWFPRALAKAHACRGLECVPTLADLRALPTGAHPCVEVLGYWEPGDGGGGPFRWDPLGTSDDNDGTVIIPDSAPAQGRWMRVFQGSVSIRWFGASENVSNNRRAIQNALDAASHVIVPPGDYVCDYVLLDSFKTLEGVGEARLTNVQGAVNYLLKTKVRSSTGSIVAGSKDLTVTSLEGFLPGAVCRVLGAEGGLMNQQTTIASVAGWPSQLEVASVVGFPSRDGTLLVGAELVRYSEIIGNSFQISERSVAGTSPGSHKESDPVLFAKSLVTTVAAVDPITNVVALDDAATFTVKNAEVEVGPIHIQLRNLRLDGNKPAIPRPTNLIASVFMEAARFFTVERCVIDNSVHVAVFVLCSRDGFVRDNRFRDNGQPGVQKGFHVALFGNGCRSNQVVGNVMNGGFFGVLLDDRSDDAHPWDGPCVENLVSHNVISDMAVGINVEGSSRNVLTYNQILRCKGQGIWGQGMWGQGIWFSSDQGHPLPKWQTSDDNLACLNLLHECDIPFQEDAGTGNKYVNCENVVT